MNKILKKLYWNKEYNFWLPLYINKKHFNQSVEIFIKEVLKIYYNQQDESIFNNLISSIASNNLDTNKDTTDSTNKDNATNKNINSKLQYTNNDGKIIKPSIIINCIIEIYCYLMTTLTVNMMKGESHISVKNMEGFFQIYNYFYQLSEKYPEITDEIDVELINLLEDHRIGTKDLHLI